MKNILKEPLLHFLVLGAGLFMLDAWRGDSGGEVRDQQIVVSEGRIQNLAALFAKTWQRPPTAQELRGLVDDFILEEALYREGKALGVDQDDTIIRRRVRQKMEFVVDDIIERVEPGEEDLKAWLAEHPDSYARPGRSRFRQIYLDPKRHPESLEQDAEQVLAELRALDVDADPRGLGDPSLLEHAFPDISDQGVIATFGEAFAEELRTRPIGAWSGPLTSAYGLHLVHIDSRIPGKPRALEEVREELARDWAFAQRELASQRYNEGLLARYTVAIEWPEDWDAEQ